MGATSDERRCSVPRVPLLHRAPSDARDMRAPSGMRRRTYVYVNWRTSCSVKLSCESASIRVIVIKVGDDNHLSFRDRTTEGSSFHPETEPETKPFCPHSVAIRLCRGCSRRSRAVISRELWDEVPTVMKRLETVFRL
jgi:hypothetical protein